MGEGEKEWDLHGVVLTLQGWEKAQCLGQWLAEWKSRAGGAGGWESTGWGLLGSWVGSSHRYLGPPENSLLGDSTVGDVPRPACFLAAGRLTAELFIVEKNTFWDLFLLQWCLTAGASRAALGTLPLSRPLSWRP